MKILYFSWIKDKIGKNFEFCHESIEKLSDIGYLTLWIL